MAVFFKYPNVALKISLVSPQTHMRFQIVLKNVGNLCQKGEGHVANRGSQTSACATELIYLCLSTLLHSALAVCLTQSYFMNFH